MNSVAPLVITIPAKPKEELEKLQHQLRVAAYCRVSTDSEEQLTSYEAQKTYYTDKIMANRGWTMAGIFADEGITGTSALKRPEFLRMVRLCRQKKIDMVLVKSITRFARNTVDCLNYIRILSALGVAILFEEENINTLEMDSELIVTILGAVAQGQSETLSHNVAWGHREAMREGKPKYQYTHLYAYEKGIDGKPQIIPEQAEQVRHIYDRFLAGDTLRMIAEALTRKGLLTVRGKTKWSVSAVKGILKNEKYCGDVLRQKTFVTDCISKKVCRNTGQLPMYLIPNCHQSIVTHETYDAVQSELARRASMRSASKTTAPTGQGRYSKYALTERLVCGECGTLYRRCVWTKKGVSYAVWRCLSRLNYGKKYCKAPTIEEVTLHRAVLAAINSAMSDKTTLIGRITGTMSEPEVSCRGQTMGLGNIDRRLAELTGEMEKALATGAESGDLTACAERFKPLTDEMTALKEKRKGLIKQTKDDSYVTQRAEAAAKTLECATPHIQEWEESIIRQLVDTVKVLSANKIIVRLKGGTEIEEELE